MAEKHRRAIEDSRRLAQLVAQERAESIRQQISAANTLLALANVEYEHGRIEQANTLLGKMQRLAQQVRGHLNEPNHVPPNDGQELHVGLEQMEGGIRALAKRLDRQSA